MADILLEGVTALVSGMLTVFVILILISFIISLFKYAKFSGIKQLELKKAEKEKVKAMKKETVAAPVSATPVVEIANQSDDMELVAVLTAAVASVLGTSEEKFVIKSYRRINKRTRR